MFDKHGPLNMGKAPNVGIFNEAGQFETVGVNNLLDFIRGSAAGQEKRDMMNINMADMTDLVTPKLSNPTQVRMVSMLFGNNTAKALTFLKAAVNSGFMSNVCPAQDRPDATEPAIDPRNGKLICRVPRDPEDTKKFANARVDNNMCSMLNLESYTDHLGNTICRRPIMSGNRFCPQPDRPDDTLLLVTDDGEGLCVSPAEYADNNTSLNYAIYPYNTNSEIANYLALLGKSVDLTNQAAIVASTKESRKNALAKVNHQLLGYLAAPSSSGLLNMVSSLSSDPATQEYASILKKVKTARDVMNFNSALYILGQQHLGLDYSLGDWFKWFGITPASIASN
jgi:hypothetical protein